MSGKVRLRKPQPWMVKVAWMFIGMVLAITLNFLYTNRVDHKRAEADARTRAEADRRWCGLMILLDEAYSSSTPATDIGKRVAAAVHDIRLSLGCNVR